jgi:hypothetical protein
VEADNHSQETDKLQGEITILKKEKLLLEEKTSNYETDM